MIEYYIVSKVLILKKVTLICNTLYHKIISRPLPSHSSLLLKGSIPLFFILTLYQDYHYKKSNCRQNTCACARSDAYGNMTCAPHASKSHSGMCTIVVAFFFFCLLYKLEDCLQSTKNMNGNPSLL